MRVPHKETSKQKYSEDTSSYDKVIFPLKVYPNIITSVYERCTKHPDLLRHYSQMSRYGINLDSSTYERIKKIFMPMQRNIGHKYI